jgi:hypothetical protein
MEILVRQQNIYWDRIVIRVAEGNSGKTPTYISRNGFGLPAPNLLRISYSEFASPNLLRIVLQYKLISRGTPTSRCSLKFESLSGINKNSFQPGSRRYSSYCSMIFGGWKHYHLERKVDAKDEKLRSTEAKLFKSWDELEASRLRFKRTDRI